MLDRTLVEQFFQALEGSDLNYEFSKDFAQRNELINRAVFPLLATYPELAHACLSDFAKDTRDDTPLHLAAFYLNIDLIRRLLALGVDVNANNQGDSVPLCIAVRVGLARTEAYQQAKLRTIELLLEFGANPNRKDSSGETPLHEAMRRSNDVIYATIVSLLLRYGADPNAMSLTGWAPIHIWSCNQEALDLMVAHGATINLPDKDGETPLMLSFTQGCGDVTALLKYGADVHARDKKRMTALHHFAMGDGFEDDLQLLLQAGSKIDSRDTRGYTPLHYAACYGCLSNVRLLLSAGADLHARSHRQETPLDVVKLRKSLAGAEPYGETPCSEPEYTAMEALLDEMEAEFVASNRRSKTEH